MVNCELCGHPMPAGEEMFTFHGYSGPCPAEPIAKTPPVAREGDALRKLAQTWRSLAVDFEAEASHDRARSSVGLAQAKEWNAMRLRHCADELEAALPSPPTPKGPDLRQWAQHLQDCESNKTQWAPDGKHWRFVSARGPCTCGLDAALRGGQQEGQ